MRLVIHICLVVTGSFPVGFDTLHEILVRIIVVVVNITLFVPDQFFDIFREGSDERCNLNLGPVEEILCVCFDVDVIAPL